MGCFVKKGRKEKVLSEWEKEEAEAYPGQNVLACWICRPPIKLAAACVDYPEIWLCVYIIPDTLL